MWSRMKGRVTLTRTETFRDAALDNGHMIARRDPRMAHKRKWLGRKAEVFAYKQVIQGLK